MRPLTWDRHSKRDASLLVMALMAASFLAAGLTFKPAHATAPTVTSTASFSCQTGGTTCSTGTLTFVISNVGDAVVIGVGWINSAGQSSSSVSTVTGGGVTDFASRVYVSGQCNTNVGAGCQPGPQQFATEIWSGTAVTTGTVTFTVTLVNGMSALGMEGYDVPFVGVIPQSTSIGSCNADSGVSCPSPATTGLTNSFANGAVVAIQSTTFRGNQPITGQSGWTFVQGASGAPAGEWSNTVSTPTNYPISMNGGGGLNAGWAVAGAIFSASVVTVTSTLNTGCLGACSGGNNGTKTTFSIVFPQLFVFYASQNTNSQAQIDNFTMKVGDVKTTTLAPTALLLVYMPATPTNPAGPGNQWTLVSGPTGTTTISVTNNTGNFFIHANPQTSICALCYYAVGIMPLTTGSRSGVGFGPGSSGWKFFETSQVGLTEYDYNMGSVTPAASFWSNTVHKPNFFMYVHTTFTVIVSGTSTVTVSGLVTSTSTVTSTTWDVNIAVTSTTNFAIILLVVLGVAMTVMMPIAIYTHSASAAGIGFVSGLMIGTGIAVQAAMVPPVFLAISMIVGIFMIVGLLKAGGGGGP